MVFLRRFTDSRFIRYAAQFMRIACYLIILFYVFCMVLSFMGRQSFSLYTKNGVFENAIYAEEDHVGYSRGMTVHLNDEIRVWTNEDDGIDRITAFGIFLIYAVNVLPLLFAFCFLSCVFSNIRKGQIFTGKNAAYLLYYGLLQIFAAVPVPLLQLFICWLITAVSDNRISITAGQNMLSLFIQGVAFIVAAYIIHYGIHLQDEVDHTL